MLTDNAKNYLKIAMVNNTETVSGSALETQGLPIRLTTGSASFEFMAGVAFTSIGKEAEYTAVRIDIGNDDTTVTAADYKLGNSVLDQFTVNSVQHHVLETNGRIAIAYAATYTNTSDASITIREIGLLRGIGYYRYSDRFYGESLLAREVLDTPITVEPNGVCTVTMTVEV